MKNIVVYSAITNNYDEIRKKQFYSSKADYVLFHDKKKPQRMGAWEIRKSYNKLNPKMNAKIHKVLSHRWFPDYDYSIYMDGNFELKIDPEYLINKFLKNNDIVLYNHPNRSSVFAEIDFLINRNKKDKEFVSLLKEQKENYLKENLGEKLYCGYVLLRKNNKVIKNFNEIWWKEIFKYTTRDQPSLVYSLKKAGAKIGGLPGMTDQGDFFRMFYPHSIYLT